MMITENTHSADVSIDTLSVTYPGNIKALDQVSLNVGSGLFGLLGPNGAGKTTLMKVLTTILQPTRGTARVFGYDVIRNAGQIRSQLGYLPQDFQSYPQLNAWEALDYYGILNGQAVPVERCNRIEQVLDVVNLTEFRNLKVGKFSGGMLRRLGIAQAILNDAPFLIFDEPTAGLDPKERIHFRNFLGELSRDRVVILSTHIVADISSACNRLAVLDHGHVKFCGTRSELIQQAQGKVWKVNVPETMYDELCLHYPITGRVNTEAGVEIRLLSSERKDPSWESVEPNMEDAYLWLLGGHHE